MLLEKNYDMWVDNGFEVAESVPPDGFFWWIKTLWAAHKCYNFVYLYITSKSSLLLFYPMSKIKSMKINQGAI